VEIELEPSSQQSDLERIGSISEPYERLAGCAGAGREAQTTGSLAGGACIGVGWRLCVGLEEKHPELVAVDLGTGEPIAAGYVN